MSLGVRILLSMSLLGTCAVSSAWAQDESTEVEEQAPPAEAPAEAEDATTPDVPESGAAPGEASSRDFSATIEALNARADALQTRIAAVAGRVLLLRENVVLGKVAPTQVLISHRNEMGSSFRLESVQYQIDGQTIFNRNDEQGLLDSERQFELLNGTLAAGAHEVTVSMTFAGSGFGLFTYLKGYKFKVQSKHKFVVAEGRLTRLDIVAYEKPDITLEPKDRLAVRYDYEVTTVNASPANR